MYIMYKCYYKSDSRVGREAGKEGGAGREGREKKMGGREGQRGQVEEEEGRQEGRKGERNITTQCIHILCIQSVGEH